MIRSCRWNSAGFAQQGNRVGTEFYPAAKLAFPGLARRILTLFVAPKFSAGLTVSIKFAKHSMPLLGPYPARVGAKIRDCWISLSTSPNGRRQFSAALIRNFLSFPKKFW